MSLEAIALCGLVDCSEDSVELTDFIEEVAHSF